MGLQFYTQHKIGDLFKPCTPVGHEIKERGLSGK